MRARFFTSFVFPLLFLLLAGGCAPTRDRADLVFLNGAEPETLDPALITGQPEGRIAGALFEGLTTFNSAADAVPGVAEHWEVSPDGLVYTFQLRNNARWSNGDPVTADDFLRSWKRTLAPETGSEYAYQLHYIKNAKAFNEGTLHDFSQVGIRAPDSLTLEVTLENPTPFFLDLCAFTTLMPVHVATVQREGDEWIKPRRLVGNGAFTLEDWRINDRIRLKKNPHYWNASNVAMRTIDVLPSARATTALNYFITGIADLMMDKGLVPNSLVGDLKKEPFFHSAPFLGTYFVRFNVTRPPFNDARVRTAFALVLDKKLLVEKITKAGEVPAASLVPPGTAGYQPPPGLQRDPEQARKLLTDAGYPDGRGFPRVGYLYKGDSDTDRNLAEEIQGMLKRELGVNMDLQAQEWKVYLRSMSSFDYDLCRSSWVGDYKDPNTFLDMFVTNGGNNRTGWSNPTYDQLIALAPRELDPQKRFEIFHQAESILIEDQVPICPLYFYVGIQFYDGEKLGGIQANLLDEHPLKAMYWKTKPR